MNFLKVKKIIGKNTKKIMTEMFESPELAELIESENNIAISILQSICKEFNIIGKADMQYIQTEYEYYKSLEQIKPEYKNWSLNNKINDIKMIQDESEE